MMAKRKTTDPEVRSIARKLAARLVDDCLVNVRQELLILRKVAGDACLDPEERAVILRSLDAIGEQLREVDALPTSTW
jgi:hypothetical protein